MSTFFSKTLSFLGLAEEEMDEGNSYDYEKNQELDYEDYRHLYEKEGKAKLTNENYAANRLAARYMLLLKDGDTTRQILVSHEDAARIKRGLYAGNLEGNRVAVLSDLNGKVVAESKKGARLQFNAEAVEEMRVVAKFLTVKSIASRREVDKLKEIIDKEPLLDEQWMALAEWISE